ncbi:MAG: sugar ABC transporter substrate-binding protein [Nocardiopsaceae bacterium]|jgi:multiple sugar transport system substrate-binding protein|nr:sugar ABC transporter substrate-binding protein [Nocardiopsaceae bacterium]
MQILGLRRKQHPVEGAPLRSAARPGSCQARRYRLVATGAVLALVSGGVAACSSGGSAGGSKNVITFANWAAAETNTAPGVAAMIKKYESLHPGITIKSEPISFTDIDQQLVGEVKAGNPPDVAELQGGYTYDLAATGGLQPLSSFATSSWQSSIIPRELGLGKISGQQVAIPWTVAPLALWYNKTVMRKAGLKPTPPATWAQLLTDAKAIHAKEPKVIVLGNDTTSREYGLDVNWPIMRSFGAVAFSGTKATANTPAMQKYLTFIRTIGKDGYTPENQKQGFFRQPAASNQVAFTIDGPYVKGVVQSLNHASNQAFYQTWAAAPLPTATGTHYSIPTDHQLVMFKNSPNKKAAWEFMNWLATSPYAVSHYTIPYEGSIPPLAHPSGTVAGLLNNPVSQVFVKQIVPEVVIPAWGASYSAAYADVMAGIQNAMISSTPIPSVASTMQTAVTGDVSG